MPRHKFEPGNTFGKGRPPGSRHKIAESFLSALHRHFEEHGVDAIERVCRDDPSTYVRTVAGLLPKEITGENGQPLLDRVKVIFVKSDRKKQDE